MNTKLTAVLATMVLAAGFGVQTVSAADNLSLKKGISFVQDIDAGFPIEAEKMEDATLEAGKPTFIFFGARGDLNTSRQAKRVVNLYNRFAKQGIKFILIDVDNPLNASAKDLLKKHYKGYIPCQVVLNDEGKSVWNKVGEIPEKDIARVIDEQIKN
ncbi:MAG: hypothetical protein IPM23_10505 [Candidatus Melainabacteria bacterium]|nr:hypothetical protein [Candidatus Melainabacteria bacterium]